MSTPAVGEALRLDIWLAERDGLTRHAARTLIDSGAVRVNGRPGRPGQRVRGSDEVTVELMPPPVAVQPLAPPPLVVVHEDAHLAVIDKPAGMVVHTAPGHPSGTLADALRARGATWSTVGGPERPGIVHRLDRDTSGLLVVAKTEMAHRHLAEQLRDRTLGRTYVALARGVIREETGTIDAPIGRDPRDRTRMAVRDGGRAAVTDFSVRARHHGLTLLEVALRTGRTHQIRVHLAYIRHPVVGDTVYGTADARLGRLGLHATRLRFVHPADGTMCEFHSPQPDAFTALLAQLSRA